MKGFNSETAAAAGSKSKRGEGKITINLRKRINDFLIDNWNKLQDDFDSIEPKDRLAFYEKLLKYGLPKMQSTKIEIEQSQTDYKAMIKNIFPTDEELEDMEEIQLDNLIEEIKS